jgi:hypothetical protein
MKNLILIITSIVTLIAILEGAGIIDVIDKDTVVVKGFCDDTNRIPFKPENGGGTGIDSTATVDTMQHAYEYMTANGTKMKFEYFLSKNALDDMFNRDLKATGIFIAPIVKDEEGNFNLLVGMGHSSNTVTDGIKNGYSYVIKTYCPEVCEVIHRTMPVAGATTP